MSTFTKKKIEDAEDTLAFLNEEISKKKEELAVAKADLGKAVELSGHEAEQTELFVASQVDKLNDISLETNKKKQQFESLLLEIDELEQKKIRLEKDLIDRFEAVNQRETLLGKEDVEAEQVRKVLQREQTALEKREVAVVKREREATALATKVSAATEKIEKHETVLKQADKQLGENKTKLDQAAKEVQTQKGELAVMAVGLMKRDEELTTLIQEQVTALAKLSERGKKLAKSELGLRVAKEDFTTRVSEHEAKEEDLRSRERLYRDKLTEVTTREKQVRIRERAFAVSRKEK